MNVTARVMRSYDYCHFEMELSAEVASLDEADELRKQAAILVDEAVEQYKEMRAREGLYSAEKVSAEMTRRRVNEIRLKPPGELTPEEAALLSRAEDAKFWQEIQDACNGYYYSEERDLHFSMLRRFKEVRVKGVSPKPAHKCNVPEHQAKRV